jgi:hypothetical protein
MQELHLWEKPKPPTPPEERYLYGLVAEFDDADDFLIAAGRTREEGYTRMEGYAPFPMEGMSEALGHTDTWIPKIMLVGGILGAFSGFGLLFWTTVVAYPLNIGGRPIFAWPSYIPITFEMTVLLSSLAGVVGMFLLNGLPSPYHPLFEAPNFDRATSDRFFLCVEAVDPRFDLEQTRSFLEGLRALQVSEVQVRK